MKPSKDSSGFTHQIAFEYYDDGNPYHYINQGEERELDIIEIIRDPISEKTTKNLESNNATLRNPSQYHAKTMSYPSQPIMSHPFQISKFSPYQNGMESTINQAITPHQFQSFDGHQHLDGIMTNPQNPGLLQFTQEEGPKRQYNGLGKNTFSGNYPVTQFQQEPLNLIQNGGFQEDSLSHPSQANVVPIPSPTSNRSEIASPPLAKTLLFNGFATLKETVQDAHNRRMGYVESESEDRRSYKSPSEEVEGPKVALDVPLEQQEGTSDLNSRDVELGADHLEGHHGKDQDFDYEIPRDNIGHLESDFSAGSYEGIDINTVSLNNELGISSDANLETGEANVVHFANSVLSSILGNLEEGGEDVPSTYNDIFNPFHIPTIEDPLAMVGPSPAAAGTPDKSQMEADNATRGVFHGGVYNHSDYLVNEERTLMAEAVDSSERQHNQLLPTGGYRPAASDSLLPYNGAEGYSSVTHNKYPLPAEGYGAPASNNSPHNYVTERDVFEGLQTGHSLAEEYGLAVNDGRPTEYGATGTADTNFSPDILGQNFFSHEQYRAPVAMESYPVTSDRALENEADPSSFYNAQFGRPAAPVVQPRTQMPRSDHNPEWDSILPSIEFDIVDENNTAEQLNKHPENQANLRPPHGTYPARENPVPYGTSLNKHAPDSLFQYASSLGNGLDVEFNKALTNKQIEEDPNDPILFFDPNSVAEDTLVNRCARECNAKLEAEGRAAIDGEIIDRETLLEMPIPSPQKPNNRQFYFAKLRRPRKDNRPRRPSLASVRSPDSYSPPRETGPEIPEYDFSNGEVPILPPDFNTAQEIKRRLEAKNAISSKKFNKRCSSCGYLGHVSSWAGCPSLVCGLCNQEGHGGGFCPKANIADRWKDRSGKAVERLNLIKMRKMRQNEMAIRLGRQEVGQRNHGIERGLKVFGNRKTRGSAQERLSPRSLLMNRRRLADENRAWVNEQGMRAPASNMTIWPTVSTFENAPTIGPMYQAQINAEGMSAHFASMTAGPKVGAFENPQNFARTNHDRIREEEMRAPASNMTTWPTAGAFENAQSFAPTNRTQINEEQMRATFSNMTAWPTVGTFENRQNFAPSSQAQIREEEMRATVPNMTTWPTVGSFENTQPFAPIYHAQRIEEESRAPIAQMAAWPMVNSSESNHNRASTTADNWSQANFNTSERQPWVDVNMGIMLRRTPDAQMMATGPTVNLNNSFGNPPNMASTTANDNWLYTEWQPFENTGTNRQGQETEVVEVADTTMTTNQRQGYGNKPSVEYGPYAEYRPDHDHDHDHDQGRWFRSERGGGAKSAKAAECSESVDDDGD